MRTMTPKQARDYVKCGYFPEPDEEKAINDLQDIFSNLPLGTVVGLIDDSDEEVGENAKKLFSLIYGASYVEKSLKLESERCELIQKSIKDIDTIISHEKDITLSRNDVYNTYINDMLKILVAKTNTLRDMLHKNLGY